MKEDLEITKALIDLSTDSIFVLQNQLIKYANQNLLNVSGYQFAELIGKKFTAFVNPAVLHKVNATYKEWEGGKKHPEKYESSVKHKNGTFIDVEVSLAHIRFEGQPALRVILRDISRIKTAEKKYRNIVNFAPIGFYQTCRNGMFTLVNNEMANILGFENTDALIEKNIADFYYSPEERERLIRQYDTSERSEVKNVEVKFRKKDGTAIWILMTARALKENGKTVNYDGFIVDISDRKANDLQLINRVRMEELFNEISYDFVHGSYLEADHLIETSLKKLGQFTEVDRVYVFQFENNGKLMSNTHEWCNIGIESQRENLQQIPADRVPWWTEKMNKFEIINYENIRDFPEKASAERLMLQEQGIVSILVLPMLSEGQLIGFVGFDSVNSQKNWIDYDVKMLKTMSDLISGEITRTKQMQELKRAKIAAEEGEKRYKSLFFDNRSVMLLINPETGNIVDANRSACKFYGYSYPQITALHISEINTLSAPAIKAEMLKAISEERQHFNFKHRLSNGEVRDVEVYAGGVKVSGNELLYTIVHDITERKLAEEKVLKLSTSVEQSPLSILITNNKGIIEYVNPYYCKITGYQANELIGDKPNIVKSGVQKKKFYKKLWKTILAGKKWEGEICNKKKNGDLYWERAVISPIHNSEGEITHFAGIKEDITEKRENQKNLKFLANALEQVGECVTITDKNDVILYVNKAFSTTYGYSKQELLGQHISFLHPENAELAELEKTLVQTKKGNWKGELINKRKDNTLFPILLSTSVIEDDKNNEIGYIGVVIDITEIKKNTNELIAAKEKAEESDRLKSAFLANMSHEIRTPMNGILGFTNLLLEPDLSDETKDHYVQIIHQSGERMLSTVTNIVEISKIEAGIVEVKNSELNVYEVIQNLISFFQVQAQKKGLLLNFEQENPEADFKFFTDKNKLESILTNLIKNAIKFTDKGEISVGVTPKNNLLEFVVTDSGIGIPKTRQTAIFNRFEQADIEDTKAFEGSGLGLSIAKSYVEILGGNMWVESIEGEGSQFYFTIPWLSLVKNESIRKASKNIRENSGSKYNVLIVEDDEVSAIYLKEILKNKAAKIVHVKSGELAINECRTTAFDVVLMDVKMPGIDGLETTKRIREFDTELVIIAQTAYAMHGDNDKAIASGCNDYLSKPIRKNELIQRIEMHLRNRRPKSIHKKDG
ncbi:PAS domain S-box protein [uncultured Draconibacterium sp.]|uniref:PAS domain S-box protein n=1 Tax=uncultured Draconibacterium sp. TaxID=1573823 RepID=UPI0025D5FD94|nr:PAS domain S-box protein [uncultured Draconibacterium sp.]